MDTKYEKEGQGHVELNIEDEGKAKGDKKLYSLLSTLTQMMHRNGNANTLSRICLSCLTSSGAYQALMCDIWVIFITT